MTEYGPSPLHKIYSTYALLDALWAYEFEHMKSRWEEELKAKRAPWKDIVVLDDSIVHLVPLSKSELDKLLDEIEGKQDE